MARHHLSIDIETRSSVDITKAGAYRYAQSPDFEILLFAYQWNNDPVKIIDLKNGEELSCWRLLSNTPIMPLLSGTA